MPAFKRTALKCIFCDDELVAGTKPEHILLDALGGRKTTTRVVCSRCNSKFGETIDKVLADQVLRVRNLMQFKSGSGDLAPQLKNIQAGDKKIHIRGDGEMKSAERPFVIEELSDGKWNLQIAASTMEEIEHYIPHIAAKLKIPEERLREQLATATASRVAQRPGVVQFSPQFGGPDAIRSMVKSALVLWALLVGNEEVRSVSFEAARSFALNGSEDFLKQRTEMDTREKGCEEALRTAYGSLYNLIYIRSDSRGRTVGYFTLYNLNSWQFVLAEQGAAPDQRIALASNPEDPTVWSDLAADEIDIPFRWLDAPEYATSFEPQKARFEALMKRYFEVNDAKARAEIVERSFIEIGLKPGDPVPAEKAQDLARIISERFACHMTGQPYSETAKSDEMAAFLKKKKPT